LSGNKLQITVVGCTDAKNLNLQWTEHEVPGTTYGLSNSGWMGMELFKAYIFLLMFVQIDQSSYFLMDTAPTII